MQWDQTPIAFHPTRTADIDYFNSLVRRHTSATDTSVATFLTKHGENGESFLPISSRKESKLYSSYLSMKLDRMFSIIGESGPSKHWIYSRAPETLTAIATAMTARGHRDAWSQFMDYIRATDREQQLYSYMGSSKRAMAYLLGGTVKDQGGQVTLSGVLHEWFQKLVPASHDIDPAPLDPMTEDMKETIKPMYVYLCTTDRCHNDGISSQQPMQWQAIDRCILALFNDPSNVNGVKIQFLLGSRAYRESISLSETLFVHLIEPQQSRADDDQATKRAVRFRSIRDSEHQHVTKIRYVFTPGSSNKSLPILTTDQSNVMETSGEQFRYDTLIGYAKQVSILCPVSQRVSKFPNSNVACLFTDDEDPPEDPTFMDGQIEDYDLPDNTASTLYGMYLFSPSFTRQSGLVDDGQLKSNVYTKSDIDQENHPLPRYMVDTHPILNHMGIHTAELDRLTVESGSKLLHEYQQTVMTRATMPDDTPSSIQIWYNDLCREHELKWTDYQKRVLDLDAREMKWLAEARERMGDAASEIVTMMNHSLLRDKTIDYRKSRFAPAYLVWLETLFRMIVDDIFSEFKREYMDPGNESPLRIQFNMTSSMGGSLATTSVRDRMIKFTFAPLSIASHWCEMAPENRFNAGRKCHGLEHLTLMVLEHEMCHMVASIVFPKWHGVNGGHHPIFGQLCSGLFFHTWYTGEILASSPCTTQIGDRVAIKTSSKATLTGIIVYKDIWGEYAHVQLDLQQNQMTFLTLQKHDSQDCIELLCNYDHPILPYVKWRDIQRLPSQSNQGRVFYTNIYPMGGGYRDNVYDLLAFDRIFTGYRV
jgi:hypothetical protein